MPINPISTWGMGRLDPFMEPNEASEIAVNLKPSSSFAKGVLLGELTATPGVYAAYASGNTDGSENPKCVNRYDCITDAQGFITFGSAPVVAGLGEHVGNVVRAADAFYSVILKTTDIPNLDAGAMTKLGARLISGTLANGIIMIPGV